MPSPSRSNLTRPIAAQSSLSHCSTVRFVHPRPLDRARPRSPAGRRSPCRRSGCRGAAGTSATRSRTRSTWAGISSVPAGDCAPVVDALAPRVLLARREAHRLRDVAHRRAIRTRASTGTKKKRSGIALIRAGERFPQHYLERLKYCCWKRRAKILSSFAPDLSESAHRQWRDSEVRVQTGAPPHLTNTASISAPKGSEPRP